MKISEEIVYRLQENMGNKIWATVVSSTNRDDILEDYEKTLSGNPKNPWRVISERVETRIEIISVEISSES